MQTLAQSAGGSGILGRNPPLFHFSPFLAGSVKNGNANTHTKCGLSSPVSLPLAHFPPPKFFGVFQPIHCVGQVVVPSVLCFVPSLYRLNFLGEKKYVGSKHETSEKLHIVWVLSFPFPSPFSSFGKAGESGHLFARASLLRAQCDSSRPIPPHYSAHAKRHPREPPRTACRLRYMCSYGTRTASYKGS